MKGFGFVYSSFVIGLITIILAFSADYIKNSLNRAVSQMELDQIAGTSNTIAEKSILNQKTYNSNIESLSAGNLINTIVLYDSRNASLISKKFLVKLFKQNRYILRPVICPDMYDCSIPPSEMFQNSSLYLNMLGNKENEDCLRQTSEGLEMREVCWFDTTFENLNYGIISDKLKSEMFSNNYLIKIIVVSAFEKISDEIINSIANNYKIYVIEMHDHCEKKEIGSVKRVVTLCLDPQNINSNDIYEALILDEQKNVLIK